ncbi:class I adenylate-forming enzyme family protein [Streptomyces sparsogenes]|uniref:Putative acyl-CoA synthetase n=1 Tax=Streptomyces sparsogenes DSM 40356 TaxID=1331668 RepID=A0A1R1SRH2_9ACTN|nr:fatty acid--CoA ligase family protein [Streptomyces sparsogenes]OMI40898.1 putative acyl-CoA synthetase [Streptomyces sparsogenes DSM 40356]
MSTGLCEEIAGRIADPRRVAVREQTGQAWSWDGLLGAAKDLAGRLRARGPLRLVAARTSRPVLTLVATLACDLLEVPLVHLDSGQTEAEHARIGAAFGPHLLLSDPGPGATAAWERDGLSAAVSASGGEGGGGGAAEGPAFGSPRSGIFLTSGSTGEPAGAVRSARAQLADALRCAAFLDYGPATPVVCAAPVVHAYGYTLGMLAPLLSGAPVTLCGSRLVPSQLAAAVRDAGARVLIALPFHYRLMAADTASRFDGLERAVSAGAPIPAGAAEAVTKAHGFALLNNYGSSETGAITIKRVDPGHDRPGDVGRPLPGIVASLLDVGEEDGSGELLLATDSLATDSLADGYAHADGLRPLSLHGDLLRTGDLATLAPDGSVRLVGRLARMVNVGGKKVNPVEVERVLAEHPAVTEAQVFAAEDGGRGQVPVARVAAPGPVTAEALIGWCRERLAEHKIPRRVEVLAELPRSATGKVLSPHAQGRAGGRTAPGPVAGPPTESAAESATEAAAEPAAEREKEGSA